MNPEYILAFDPIFWYVLFRNLGAFCFVFLIVVLGLYLAWKILAFLIDVVLHILGDISWGTNTEIAYMFRPLLEPPPDLKILGSLIYIMGRVPHGQKVYIGRAKYNNQSLEVDFGSSHPEFIGHKYKPIKKGLHITVYGLRVVRYDPLRDNVWECAYDYFDETRC